MLAAAGAVDPAVSRLVHVLLGRQRLRGTRFRIIFGVRRKVGAGDVPQVGPFDAQLRRQTAHQRQAQADDAVRIAFDRVDERAAETFQSERSGHFQRLAGGDVAFDIQVGIFAEVQGRFAGAAHHAARREVDEAMAGPQLAGGTAHGTQPFARYLFAMRLAVAFAVQQEHGIAAENQRAGLRTGQAWTAIHEIGDRLGDGGNGDAGEIAGLRLVGGLRAVRACGCARRGCVAIVCCPEREADHALPARVRRGIGDVAIRLVHGLGLRRGENHHTLFDAQVVHGDAKRGRLAFERGRLVDVRDTDGRADAGGEQHVTAWTGLGGENQRDAHARSTCTPLVSTARCSTRQWPDASSSAAIRSSSSWASPWCSTSTHGPAPDTVEAKP